jgi:hypothetical protein
MTGLALALYDKLWPWRYARSKGRYADAGKKSLFLCGIGCVLVPGKIHVQCRYDHICCRSGAGKDLMSAGGKLKIRWELKIMSLMGIKIMSVAGER